MDSANTTSAVKNMDFDNWDPRKKDFQDTSFNSYLVGPGSYLDSSLLPGVSRQRTDDVRCKLHVRNIPSDLTEQGMKNLFSTFGEILDIYKNPSYDWGFISYGTIREAELAIRELNRNKKLFNLVVQFARSMAEKERLKQEEIKADMLESVVSRIPFVAAETKTPRKPSSGIGRGNLPLHLQTFGNPGRRSAQTACRKEKDGFFSYPIPGFFGAVNRAVMETVSVEVASKVGHRQVTMGRGYFPLGITSIIIQDVEKSTQPAYDSCKEERFEFGKKADLSSLIEGCQVCGTNTTSYCQVCRTSYCSRNCQMIDWPEHKKYCSVNGIATEKKLQQQEAKPRKEWKSSVLGKTTNEKPLLAQTGICTSSSVIDQLSHNDVISGRLTRWVQEKTCYLSVVPSKLQKEFNKIKDMLPLACDILPDSNYKPEVGEMVAALVRDEQMSWMKWNRGIVLSVHKGHYEVNLCDLGLIAKVTTVMKLPEDFISIPEFGVHCTIIEDKPSKDMKWVPLETEIILKVQNVNKDDKKVTCKTENECIVVLGKWSPNIEIGDLEAVSVESGDTVVLSAFFDQSNVYVRPVSQKSKEAFKKLCRDVAVHCYTAPHLPVSPVKAKQLVGCRFSGDGNYYRAQILHINENDIEVCFVDFGNIEIVTQNDIKELTEEIKMHPCMAVKVSLEDVDCVPLTEAALEFVFKLIGREEEMKIFFSSKGAKLQLPKAKTVNEELRVLLEPSWKRKLQEGLDLFGSAVFMEQDLPIQEPPLDKPVELFILNKLDDFTFICCEYRSKTMYYIQEILTKQITEYCNTSDQEQYIPRSQELCLAKWDIDGKWYRALFISDHKVKLENNVLFVDFGNMAYVDYKDIRKMISDFMNISTAAFFCTIECKEEFPGIGNSVKTGNMYEAVIVKKIGYGSFLIEMSHVTAIENETTEESH